MEQPSITLMGALINEPIASLTDIFLSILGLLFFILLKPYFTSEIWKKKWAYFFLLLSISTLIGAFAHGFKSYYTEIQFHIIWLFMNCIGLLSSHYSIVASIIYCNFKPVKQKIFISIINIITLVFIVLCIVFNQFVLVKIYAGIGLFALLAIHIAKFNVFKTGNSYLIFSVFLALTTLVIHSTQFSLSIWFNYKDISHVIMMVSLFFIFTGVRLHTFIEQKHTI